MLSLIETSTFASIFHKFVNPVSIIYMISVAFDSTISAAKTISTALISSRSDYCNSLLNNIAKRDLAKLTECNVVWHVWFSGRLGFHHHYHYLNNYTGFLLLIELIISCPRLHIMLYLHNNHLTWLVSCIFQISLGRSDHQFHLLCLKQNLT